ncbi:FAD-dependent oxidoreductase [Rhodococcus sp. D2-41]|uniref:NAD(P)/FAD-dependent oxidoreductase n=1 Tax=Speluncibacter jeojiensis TaxID=2710754 RepID=UPI00241077B3|nr:FAD-dependent oxidoreductase [Rhodococcus sp. D2-41]MDG3012308.1 FAD-dependent oxidoreductase [Rhodococcus sp. D2-41]
MSTQNITRILIVGGGTVGVGTAARLQSQLNGRHARITLVNPLPHMAYRPLLPEVAAGLIDPNDLVVPLRKVLRKCEVVVGTVTRLEHATRRAWVGTPDGEVTELDYDIVVMTAGSIVREQPVTGGAGQRRSCKTLTEATYLRDHVLSRIAEAAATTDAGERRRLLTFVLVGGGYEGMECLTELDDLVRFAVGRHPGIVPGEVTWAVVEESERILRDAGSKHAVRTLERLAGRGVRVYLNTAAEATGDGHLTLSDGTEVAAGTVIWNAPSAANPMLLDTDLPLDARGRLRCTSTLQVAGESGAFGAGDIAVVPDLTRVDDDPSAVCRATALHAHAQAKVLADNVESAIAGTALRQYHQPNADAGANPGLYRSFAEVRGGGVEGGKARLLHWAYHVARIPGLSRKTRIFSGRLPGQRFRRHLVERSIGGGSATVHEMPAPSGDAGRAKAS